MRVNIPEFNYLPERYIKLDLTRTKCCIHLQLPLEIFLRLQWLTTGDFKQIGKVELISLLLARMFAASDKNQTSISCKLPRYLYPLQPMAKE